MLGGGCGATYLINDPMYTQSVCVRERIITALVQVPSPVPGRSQQADNVDNDVNSAVHKFRDTCIS